MSPAPTSLGSAWQPSWGCLVSAGQEPLPLLSHSTHFQLQLCTFYRRLTEWGLLPNGQNQTLLDKALPGPAWWCSPLVLSCSLPVWRGSAGGEQESSAHHPCWGVRGSSREGEPASTQLGVRGQAEPSQTSPALGRVPGAGIVPSHREELMKRFGCC